MTLGEKITRLRTERHWTQGELAEKMEVSRQSVSKWETGSSVPELDKLIAMSEVFGISLDALVKGREQEENAGAQEEAPAAPPEPSRLETRKIVGYILLGVGLLSVVFGIFLNLLLAALGGYLLLCSIICLTVKKHSGLVIGWATYLPCAYFLSWVTGANMRMVFQPIFYWEFSEFTGQFIVSYGFWALLFLLAFVTVRKTRLKKHPFLFFGWVVFLQIYSFIPIAFRYTEEIDKYYIIVSWCVIIFFLALLFFTGKNILAYLKNAKQIKEK